MKYSSTNIEQRLLFMACVLMMAVSLFFIHSQINAQNQSASVSATVLPNKYNTHIKQKNFFEKMTVSQRITAGTISGLVVSGSFLGYLLFTAGRGKMHA